MASLSREEPEIWMSLYCATNMFKAQLAEPLRQRNAKGKREDAVT